MLPASRQRCSHLLSRSLPIKCGPTCSIWRNGFTARRQHSNRSYKSTLTCHATSCDLPPLKQQLKEIRARVVDGHLRGGLIYLSAGDRKLRNGQDVHYKFRPHSDFSYVSGMAEPGASCVLDSESGEFILLVPKVPEAMAVWMGELPSTEQLAEEVGADRCSYTSDLAAILKERFAGRTVHTLSECANALASLNALEVACSCETLRNTLNVCRSRKTESEVACLQHANRVSGQAHMAMWRACRPGMREYQLEAVFTGACMDGGLMQMGYPPIVAAGRNAATLHYERNDAVVQAHDMVLVDAGAEYRCYTADISRTFPASGTFLSEQRQVYDAVLQMQRVALELMLPGTLWTDMEWRARVVLLEFLQDFGCIRSGLSLREMMAVRIDKAFLPHTLGHCLGLDVHDVEDTGRSAPEKLAAGHVVTCEPGIYFHPNLIQRAAADPQRAQLLHLDRIEALYHLGGVRIEDNVAITTGGHINLTTAAGVPSDADDIQAIMSS